MTYQVKDNWNGKVWEPKLPGQHLALLSDNTVVVITPQDNLYSVEPLDMDSWDLMLDEPVKIEKNKITCTKCHGLKMTEEIVDHNEIGDTVYGNVLCWKCNGLGYTVED